RWMLVLCIGTLTMAVGFAVRIVRHNHPSEGVYIVETLFILLSPCAFLAQDYVILPRLAKWLSAEGFLFINPAKVVKIFVWSDCLTFFLQSSGGGLTAVKNSKSIPKLGSKIALIGLVIQALSFGTFTLMALVFGLRVRSRTPQKWTSYIDTGAETPSDWRMLWLALMWTTVGILIRSVYRIIEYAQGYGGYLATHEGFFYCLDALPLLLAISVYIFVWPPLLLNSVCRFGPDRISMTPVKEGQV
ncbi:RTA1 like protein, partial [Fistulina hepatica ATCC 64428]